MINFFFLFQKDHLGYSMDNNRSHIRGDIKATWETGVIQMEDDRAKTVAVRKQRSELLPASTLELTTD